MWQSPRAPSCSFLRCATSRVTSEEAVGWAEPHGVRQSQAWAPGGGPGTGGLRPPCFPLPEGSALSHWTPTPVPRANTLRYFTRLLPLSNISNFWESSVFLIVFPSSDSILFLHNFVDRERTPLREEHTLLSHDPCKQEVPCTHGLIFLLLFF